MITLNGITLPEDMIIDNYYQHDDVVVVADRTIGGRLVYTERTNTAGRPLDLISDRDFGWIEKSVLDQIAALRVAGATYSLVYETETFNVRFRFEDAPVLDFQALIPRANTGSTDYYYGIIKLITV